jgi:glutathione S-transferase
MRGFRGCSAPRTTPKPADEDKVKERGKEIVEKGFAVLDKALAGKDSGGKFSSPTARCSTSSSGAASA